MLAHRESRPRLHGSADIETDLLSIQMTTSSIGISRVKHWARFFFKFSYPRDLKLVFQALTKRRRFQVPGSVWPHVESISGFMEAKECGLLYWAAAEWPISGPVLELGAFEGRSTTIFVLGGRQVHAVDAWTLAVDDLSAYGGRNDSPEDAFERFKNNIRSAKADSQVSIHRGLTHTKGSR